MTTTLITALALAGQAFLLADGVRALTSPSRGALRPFEPLGVASHAIAVAGIAVGGTGLLTALTPVPLWMVACQGTAALCLVHVVRTVWTLARPARSAVTGADAPEREEDAGVKRLAWARGVCLLAVAVDAFYAAEYALPLRWEGRALLLATAATIATFGAYLFTAVAHSSDGPPEDAAHAENELASR